MKKILVDECELDPGVLALAYVYFEKLVLYEKINKENRKLLAGWYKPFRRSLFSGWG